MMNQEGVFRLIASNLMDIIPDLEYEAIEYKSKLCLLGASSVGRAELIEKTLEDLKLDADRFDFHLASNLGELAVLLFERIKQKTS